MKSAFISRQRAVYLIRQHTNVKYNNLKQIIEHQQDVNGILLSSGAKLYYNPDVNPNGGWFISGYAATGWDTDCYINKTLYAKVLKEGRIIENSPIGSGFEAPVIVAIYGPNGFISRAGFPTDAEALSFQSSWTSLHPKNRIEWKKIS